MPSSYTPHLPSTASTREAFRRHVEQQAQADATLFLAAHGLPAARRGERIEIRTGSSIISIDVRCAFSERA